ncbi:hypothetical protein PC116_g29228 [Phytophthora cactorum]|nr:hypothetical protein PC116_g29228 [Phytophthora cactorum]
MVKLFCAIVGVAGNVFSVRVDESDSVDDLKKAIAEDQKYDFAASKLQFYLAKKGSTWLTEEEVKKGVSDTTGLKLLDAVRAEIGDVGLSQDDVRLQVAKEEVAALKGPVNVLVVVPEGAGVGVASVEPSALPTAMHRHPERLKRWAAINEMIRQKNQEGNEKTSNQDTNRKRKNRDIDSSMPYSSLSWTDLEPILPMEDFNLQASPVPHKVVEELHDRLVQICKLYGDIYSGKEAKCQFFIMAIIEAVCVMVGDATILVEEDVKGKNVHVHGRFEFVLKRGRKRISIVEAKRDDITQGIAQNVAGLEALSDVEGLERTLGIVTNYLEWVFISDDDEKIRRINETLKIRGSVPSIKSLSEIVGMIYGLLANST